MNLQQKNSISFAKEIVNYDSSLLMSALDVESPLWFKEFMNKQHTNMKFIDEKEINNKIPFLDIKVVREGRRNFVTTVFRKGTFTSVLTNWSSVFEGYKISLVYTLLHRCYLICSAWPDTKFEGCFWEKWISVIYNRRLCSPFFKQIL